MIQATTTQSATIRASRRRLGVVGVLLFVLGYALLAGCGDDDAEARIYDVTVTINEDSIDPTTIALRTPDRAVITVENRSGASCEFHLGPYVRGLHVEDGDDASIAFTVVDIEEAVTSMGCEGGITPDGEVQVLDATERE